MSESAFSRQVREKLHERYYPRGVWWLNSTGYEMHHDPFPTRGAGDLLGAICGKWCEIELKTATGKMRMMQLKRQELCLKLGLIYLVVRSIEELRAKVDAHDDKLWVPQPSAPRGSNSSAASLSAVANNRAASGRMNTVSPPLIASWMSDDDTIDP